MKCGIILFVVIGIFIIGGSCPVGAADNAAELSKADYERLKDIYNNGKTEELKQWIDKDLNVNAAYECRLPLNLAIRQMAFAYGSIALSNTTPQKVFEQVKLLIDAGADVNSAINVGCKIDKSPLEEALSLPMTLKTLQFGTIDAIDNVFKENISKCEKISYEGTECEGVSEKNMLLVRAEMNKFYELKQKEIETDVLKMMELLINNGADVNKTDSAGRTALHHAVNLQMKVSSLNAIKFLIKNGADVNARDNKGNTPLFFTYDNPELRQYLIQAGTDTTLRNNNGLLYTEVMGRTLRQVLDNGVYYEQADDRYK